MDPINLIALRFILANCKSHELIIHSLLIASASCNIYIHSLKFFWEVFFGLFLLKLQETHFSGFDFDLDEVWAPLNPHLKHVTKGSPSEKIEF